MFKPQHIDLNANMLPTRRASTLGASLVRRKQNVPLRQAAAGSLRQNLDVKLARIH